MILDIQTTKYMPSYIKHAWSIGYDVITIVAQNTRTVVKVLMEAVIILIWMATSYMRCAVCLILTRHELTTPEVDI